ncbi:septal ring lytic transglycosylase RlpA family protein [Nibribacter ruber]|uniref:Probable endolytic peptidoglycan transglycosylase RlpA n=1 Tax=Nibribacter ruber TaxID=2698458 RepID=A0A6P1NVZ9_9BACT|nr:septal ring lytic transglycosylase RlpA family protein [Nibribacter ruber]QHL87887.1 septal ring lytic transglycosylase RlpA family protein [Nibribacter ruber]
MGIQKIYHAIVVLFISFIAFAPTASAQEVGETQKGLASWYGAKYHGRKTSSGEVYNRHKLTAAHNGLPLGTIVKVTNLSNGESVVVKINDRGPFKGRRIIDLSEAAAKQIKYRNAGLAEVSVEVVELPQSYLAKRSAPAAAPATEVKQVSAETVLTANTVSSFVIQAGAFGSLANAQAQLEKLKRIYQQLPVSLMEETVNGKTVHRIVAGKFQDKATAEQARQDLVKKGFQGLVKEMKEPAQVVSAI